MLREKKEREAELQRRREAGELEEENEEEEEEEEYIMGDDEYYPEGHIENEIEDSAISRKYSKFKGVYGLESYRRFNLQVFEDDVILYACGNQYIIENLKTGEKQIFHGKNTDGIGSLSVHPDKRYYAVADKGPNPIIYIYDYKDNHRLYR